MKKMLKNFYVVITIIMIILISCIAILSVWECKKLESKTYVNIFYLNDYGESILGGNIINNYENYNNLYINNVTKYDVNECYDDFVNQNFIVASLDSKENYPKDWLENFNRKIIQLQKEFPSDMYWNHADICSSEQDLCYYNTDVGINIYSENTGVTNIPCNHYLDGEKNCNIYNGISTNALGFTYGTQCAGFSSMLSDRVFGNDAPIRMFTDYDDIKIGDQARINSGTHSVFIIDKTDDYVVVAECNSDYCSCRIQWGRMIARDELIGVFYSRW